MTDEPESVDIHDLVKQLCDRIGIRHDFVRQITIDIDTLTADVYRGTEGRTKGHKFVNKGLPGLLPDAATEELRFRITA